MSMGFDVANDWRLDHQEDSGEAQGVSGLELPHGWSAPPPDSFQPAGDEAGEAQLQKGPGAGSRAARGAKRGQNKASKGAGHLQKNRAAAADGICSTPDVPTAKSAESEARGGGRGGGRPLSANTASRGKRSGGDKAAKNQVQAPAEGAAGAPAAAAVSKEKPLEASSPGAVAGGGLGGGKPARSKGRGGGKMVTVPANIRLAAEDVRLSADGVAPAAPP